MKSFLIVEVCSKQVMGQRKSVLIREVCLLQDSSIGWIQRVLTVVAMQSVLQRLSLRFVHCIATHH